MTGTALILGANGRVGRATTLAFANAGWQVRAASRLGKSAPVKGVSNIACNVLDQAALIDAAQGADVIVHAVHPAYPDWAKIMPIHTANIIAAGLASGATVLISGNVYPFGENAAVTLDENDTPVPTTRKGVLRVTMEHAFKDAVEQGLRSVVLRSGDFIEQTRSGNWFDAYITNKVHKGKFTYPGRMDAVHAWAYLPDVAQAMVGLAEQRAGLPAFSSFGFEGFSLTGAELMVAAEKTVGRPLRRSYFPWPLLRALSPFSPLIYETLEMRYLWNTPHRIEGSALRAALPGFVETPLAEAMADVLGPVVSDRSVMRQAVGRSA